MQKMKQKRSVGFTLLLLIVTLCTLSSRTAYAEPISKDVGVGTGGGVTFSSVEDVGPGGGENGGETEPPGGNNGGNNGNNGNSGNGSGTQTGGSKPTIFPHTGEIINSGWLLAGIVLVIFSGILFWRRKKQVQ